MRYAHLAPESVREAVSVLDKVESRFGHVEQIEKDLVFDIIQIDQHEKISFLKC